MKHFSVLLCLFGVLMSAAVAGTPALGKGMESCSIYDASRKIVYKEPYKLGGILPRVWQSDNIVEAAQLFNPYAPSSYGYGKGLVSVNRLGKPKGFIVLSLPF